MIDIVRVVFRCWMTERLVLLVIMYDIRMALTSCWAGLIRRACLLVETDPLCWGTSHIMLVTVRKAPKTGGRSTPDEADRESSAVS